MSLRAPTSSPRKRPPNIEDSSAHNLQIGREIEIPVCARPEF